MLVTVTPFLLGAVPPACNPCCSASPLHSSSLGGIFSGQPDRCDGGACDANAPDVSCAINFNDDATMTNGYDTYTSEARCDSGDCRSYFYWTGLALQSGGAGVLDCLLHHRRPRPPHDAPRACMYG